MKKLFAIVLVLTAMSCSEDVVEPKQCYECITTVTNGDREGGPGNSTTEFNHCGSEKDIARIEKEGTYGTILVDPNSARYEVKTKTRCYRDY